MSPRLFLREATAVTIRNLCTLLLVASFLGFMGSTAAAQQPRPSQVETIYVMPSSHWDLGFLAPPEDILPRLKPHIDEVIANCKADPEFRWTIESVWQVREWLTRTDDPALIEDFKRLVGSGQIQLSAVFGSMHTEFMSAEMLNRIAYDAKDLEARLGVKTDFAMMNDVPGFTQRLPQVLARSGIKYFVNGSNLFIGGGTSLSPGKVPFYWESPDGSKILTWHTQSKLGGYTEALADYWLDPISAEPYTKEPFYPEELKGKPPLEIMEAGVSKLLKRLDEAQYPYDAVLLMYLHDFISSNQVRDQLMPSVRAWNAAGRKPRIVIATPAEFFRHMEGKYAGKLATYRGDWTGLWAEVKTNSPRISANARWAQDHLPVAETIWSLLSFRPGTAFPAGNVENARLKLLKYEEHSGSGQVGWPKLMSRQEVDDQNRQYVEYTREARREVDTLIRDGLKTLLSQQEQTAGRTLVVFNPLSWERSDVVQLRGAGNIRLKDVASGTLVPLQRVSDDEVVFVAKAVPALGYRTYSVEEISTKLALPASRPVNTIENRFYRVLVRPSDGAILSVFDKSLRTELVDHAAGKSLALPERWSLFAEQSLPLGSARVRVTSGPVAERVHISRPGSVAIETVLTLYRDLKRLDISHTLDSAAMPYVASLQAGEYYSFLFPLAFNGSAARHIHDGASLQRVPEDSLPGARVDAAAPQHATVLTGALGTSAASVTVASRQSFFLYWRAFPGTDGKPVFLNAFRIVGARKQDQGETRDVGMVNFASVEPGLEQQPLRFDFSLRSDSAGADPIATYRFGSETNLPLIPALLNNGTAPAQPVASFLRLSAPNVVVLAFRPSRDGNGNHFLLRLQEIAGKATDAELTTTLPVKAVERTTLTEDQVLGAVTPPLRIAVGAHETVTLRLDIPHEQSKRSHRWWEW